MTCGLCASKGSSGLFRYEKPLLCQFFGDPVTAGLWQIWDKTGYLGVGNVTACIFLQLPNLLFLYTIVLVWQASHLSVLLSFVTLSLPDCGGSVNTTGHVGARDLTARGDIFRQTVQVCRTGPRPVCNLVTVEQCMHDRHVHYQADSA
jgi:hypothetical protein